MMIERKIKIRYLNGDKLDRDLKAPLSVQTLEIRVLRMTITIELVLS
jgi:hypothetical protein